MSIISPADLEASPLADLHALASALGIDGFRRLRKDDLVDAILARQGASVPPRARARTPRAAAAVAPPEEVEVASEDDGPPREGSDERPPRSSRPRRRRGRTREPGDESSAPIASDRAREEQEPATERIAEGVVELLVNGSGFLRVNANEISDEDVYISAAQARRCELVTGDRISGPVRAARRSERHPSLIRIDTINGVAAEQAVAGTRIDEIDVDFPTEAFSLGEDPGLAALPPFGRGSRVLIVGPARSGRSVLLGRIGVALAATEGLDVELLAVGVRPEELSEWKGVAHATSSGLSFAASIDAQESAVEQATERGRRVALRGGNAVLLIDTLDGLSAGAVRRTMAAARNLRGAGSVSVIATARASLGGETTLIGLLAEGDFPAIDAAISGTLRAELLAAAPAAKPVRVRKPRAPRKTAASAQADAAGEPPDGAKDAADPNATGEKADAANTDDTTLQAS
jgi:transcription termination factor Rho